MTDAKVSVYILWIYCTQISENTLVCKNINNKINYVKNIKIDINNVEQKHI